MNEKIGKFIRSMREQARLTQSELGKAVGVTFQQIQKYESGKNRTSITMFIKICEACGVSPVDGMATIKSDDSRGNKYRIIGYDCVKKILVQSIFVTTTEADTITLFLRNNSNISVLEVEEVI